MANILKSVILKHKNPFILRSQYPVLDDLMTQGVRTSAAMVLI